MTKRTKLQITLNQWTEILEKEMKISEDLRKNEVIEQAEMMISKLNIMIENTVEDDFPKINRNYKYRPTAEF